MKMSETSLSMHKLNDVIEHYKRHIGRATEANDNDKIMKCLLKLSRLPITVQNLQKTGIGRVVNSLRKYDGNIGESAKSLVVQWKNVVKIEESENFYQKNENSDEEHEDVSSANDTEELQISQNITSSVASTSYYNNSSNDPGLSDENNDHSSDHGSCKSYNHYENNYEKMSKYKKNKKDRESKKRKESSYTSTDEQGDEKNSKKMKKDSKYESVKIKKESEKIKVTTTSRRENDNNCEDNIKKDKKSSHSDKKKDKHKSTHKSESRSESKSHRDKHESHRDKHESKSGHKDKTDPKRKSKEKNKDVLKQESKASASSSTSSCKTFEEALLGIEMNKKKGKSKCRDLSSRSNSSERESSPISTSMQLAPINLDPEELITNYKPLPQIDIRKKKSLEEIDALSTSMKTKNMRTKVYSGNKCNIYTEVPSLSEFCIKTLKENIDELGETGGVPYLILAPVLSHATPDQLYQIENHNFYLIEDTGPLWEYHSKREFRNTVPDKNETWRNFYIRCLEEREIKLAKLRRHINANQAASTPVRKTQLAYVDSMAKPPRGIAKRQAKYHTPSDTKLSILSKSIMGGHSTAEALSSSNRSITMATSIPIALSSNQSASSSSALKKKKAPLMQKALQLIKSTRRR